MPSTGSASAASRARRPDSSFNSSAANHWKYVSSSTDLYKKFEKELKGTKYWKIYNKKEKNESIDYLDRVMDKIMLFKNDGLKSETQFNEVLNMLYAN